MESYHARGNVFKARVSSPLSYISSTNPAVLVLDFRSGKVENAFHQVGDVTCSWFLGSVIQLKFRRIITFPALVSCAVLSFKGKLIIFHVVSLHDFFYFLFG